MEESRKLRVLYVCADPGIPIFGRKGCSTHVRETCRFLSERGHTVHLLAANAGEDFGGDVPFTCTFVPSFKKKFLGKDVRLLLNNLIMFRKALQVIKMLNPDIIYERYSLYAKSTEIISKILKIPRIVEINSPLAFEQKNRLRAPWLAEIFEKNIFRNSQYAIVVSKMIKDHLASLGVSPSKISIQPIAVDSRFFETVVTPPPEEVRATCADRLVIGYVGTLLHYHRVNILIDMARELRESIGNILFLMIGGEKSKVEKYRARAHKDGVDDVFLFVGSVRYRDLPLYIDLIDIGIIPNTAPWAAPTKMFEYAAMKKPIIAPDYPAVRDFIPEESHWLLFPPYTSDGIVEKIEKLARDTASRTRLGEINRERVLDGYTWQHYIDRIEEIAEDASKREN